LTPYTYVGDHLLALYIFILTLYYGR
jgi:hypothetical protein